MTLLGIQSSDLNSLDGAAKLNDNEADALEGHLTLEEISNALKSMKNQKTPGIDDFPAEFFKVFWGKLKYSKSLNHAYISGQMSLTLRQCIISCLPKGDKPQQFLKNRRVISLLSVIYKIASTALASRLRSPLEKNYLLKSVWIYEWALHWRKYTLNI